MRPGEQLVGPNSDFAGTLDALVDAFGARAGGVELAPLAPWRALAGRIGPTPRSGPLTHDLLPPTPRAPTRVGLNVFGHDAATSEAVAETARAWAALWLGDDAAHWIDEVPRTTRFAWNGGALIADGAPRLKLYFTMARPDGLVPIFGVLGREPVPSALAVGVDLTRDGPARVRTYHRPTPGWLEGWPELGTAAADWTRVRAAGLSHQLVTVLGTRGDDDAKRALNLIFGPRAPLDALSVAAEFAPAVPDARPRDRFGELAARCNADAFALRPVAYEIDGRGDGSVDADLLLTIGERDPP